MSSHTHVSEAYRLALELWDEISTTEADYDISALRWRLSIAFAICAHYCVPIAS